MKFQEFLDHVLPDKHEQNRLRDHVIEGKKIVFCGYGIGKSTLRSLIKSQYEKANIETFNECDGIGGIFEFKQPKILDFETTVNSLSIKKWFKGE